MAIDLRGVDPAELRMPHSRHSGADPYKLQRQIARFGKSVDGMPPVWVYERSDGELEIINGLTRGSRNWHPAKKSVLSSSEAFVNLVP